MKASFRDAGPGDGVQLERIFKLSFCDTFAHLYASEDLETFLSGFGVDDWERQILDPSFAFRIAEANDSPVAYVKLGPLKLPIQPEGPAILVDQLYVLKEFHGCGLAHELMDWALATAEHRQAREVYLTVYVDNHRARRFYDRYGFEAVGRYDFMVGNHADEDIILRKRL